MIFSENRFTLFRIMLYDPAIHVFVTAISSRRRCPGQARAWQV